MLFSDLRSALQWRIPFLCHIMLFIEVIIKQNLGHSINSSKKFINELAQERQTHIEKWIKGGEPQ